MMRVSGGGGGGGGGGGSKRPVSPQTPVNVAAAITAATTQQQQQLGAVSLVQDKTSGGSSPAKAEAAHLQPQRPASSSSLGSGSLQQTGYGSTDTTDSSYISMVRSRPLCSYTLV